MSTIEKHLDIPIPNKLDESIQEKKDQKTSQKKEKQKTKQIFLMFLLSTLFLNYDTGVIPASLLEIIKEIPLDYSEQALLGSLVYLGLSFASLFVSILFNRYGPSKVCSFMLILNSLCCFVFSISTYKPILYSTRFLMGVSEAFIVIYAPVWVNNYAPQNKSATWMGILHSFAAIGVITGYLLAGLTINYFNFILSWRFSIRIQGVAQIPLSIYFYFEDESLINVDLDDKENVITIVDENSIAEAPVSGNRPHLNLDFESGMKKSPSENLQKSVINNKEFQTKSVPMRGKSTLSPSKVVKSRIDSVRVSNMGRYCQETKEVVFNALYIWVTLSLCSIYFIVTGIQFWMTSYLIDILGNDPAVVLITFSVCSITAPLGGVIVGGTFADKYGGYKGKNSLKALKLCSAFGVVAFVFAFPIGFLNSMIYITVLLWAFLFFGAAIVPIGTGIMVSCVRRDYQATSSSISQLVFNLFGYFSAPILTGILMDNFTTKEDGYKWGMRLIFWWSIFSVIFMSLAWIVAYNRYKEGNSEEKDLIDEDMGNDMVELVKLEVMRRMAQGSSAF